MESLRGVQNEVTFTMRLKSVPGSDDVLGFGSVVESPTGVRNEVMFSMRLNSDFKESAPGYESCFGCVV